MKKKKQSKINIFLKGTFPTILILPIGLFFDSIAPITSNGLFQLVGIAGGIAGFLQGLIGVWLME